MRIFASKLLWRPFCTHTGLTSLPASFLQRKAAHFFSEMK